MRILFIHQDSKESGSGLCLYELLKFLKKEGSIDPVVLLHKKNAFYDVLKDLSVEVYCCRYGYTATSKKSVISRFFWGRIYRPLANLMAYFYLKKNVDLKKIDLIHSNTSVIDFGAFLRRKIKTPHVWHFREFGDKDFELIPFNRDFASYVNCNTDKIIAVSQAIREYYVNKGVNPQKICCLYDGVVGDDFAEQYSKKKISKCLKIVMTGRVSKEKGQDVAVEALRLLSPKMRENVFLDFYGKGVMLNSLIEKTQKYGLVSNVTFKGFSEKLNELLNGYDVGLNLSCSEGFGRTTVEYMLSGLYVVGTESGATPEILNNGACGSLIPVNNPQALADELCNIYRDRDLYQEKAKTGSLFAKSNFCLENNYLRIIGLLKDVANVSKNL